ncbi:COP1-interactive protein 1-like isoform X3 [Agrilus planipennis]|uniref:COP1-interactive protein 1-like isoform X3 n=1 Tax=Agrilus planipennis TaxID=224129 RepID=A0A7F5RDM2_AGRPL|nr:COP1-interactive protein 1-like isoform X3 [Agrilus planipennis]XP_025834069.1 COP1-interactive protein 1-like isoform X3 [Agrilus planipennis]
MENNGWESVLIEWVNCLQLSNTIKELNELKNGDFFSRLLAVITQDKNLNDVDILTTIFKTLKKEYPHCQFDNEKTVHIQDLTNNDIIIISSLLMHYSCVFEHRDVLTSPLCQRLSHHTQLCIRMFLEKIQNDVTKDILFETIKNCTFVNEFKKKLQSSQWMSGGDSPLSSRSPLQELLYTPGYKKAYIQEREREINKLRQELEVERYEKLDIQEELKQQQEHNEKIGKELSEKLAEIKKLRSELVASQYASPFKSDDQFSQDLQRRLKGEIKNLERYVLQLESEIEKLQNERSSLNENLVKVEREYNAIQDKCLYSEHKYDILLEKYEIQRCELQNLHQHCNELTTLLDELKNSKSNDSYIEVESINCDFQKRKSIQSTSCEDLAHAVVEVQLRESLKENNDLKSILKATQEMNNTLQGNIDIGNKKLQELNKQCEDLQVECQELKNKVSILHETQLALEETKTELAQLTQTIKKLDTEKNTLNLQIDSMEDQLNLTKNLLSESESEKETLNTNIKLLHEKIIVLDKRLYEKDIACDAFERQSKELQKDLETSMEKFNATHLELEKLTDKFNFLDQGMEASLQKLESLVYEEKKNEFDYQHKKGVFDCILSQIELDKVRDINDKKNLREKIVQLEELVSYLQDEIKKINDEKVTTVQEKILLADNLLLLEKKVGEMQIIIEQYESKIDNFNNRISGMSATIEELEMLKIVVKEKEIAIETSQSKVNVIENELLSVREEVTQHKQINDELRLSKEKLIAKVNELNEELSQIQNSYVECNQSKNNLERKLQLLEEEKTQLSNQLSSINNELAFSRNNEVMLQNEIENNKKIINELQEKITQSKFELAQYEIVELELKRTINDVKSDKEQLQQELAKKTEIAFEIQNTLSDCHKKEITLKTNLEEALRQIEFSKITEENLHKEIVEKEKKYLKEIGQLQEQIQSYKCQVSQLEEKLNDSVKNASQMSLELENTEQHKAKLEEELDSARQEFERKVSLLNTTIAKLEENVNIFSNKKEELQEILNKRTHICQNLEIDNQGLLIKQKEMEQEIKGLSESLKSKEKECVELASTISDLSLEKDKANSELETKIDSIKDMEAKVQSQEYAIYHLNQLIQAETSRVEKYDIKIKELVKEIEIITNLKVLTEEKYVDLERNSSTAIKELVTTTEQLRNTLAEHTDFQNKTTHEIEVLKKELQEKCEQYEDLVSERSNLVTQHDGDIERLNKEIFKLKTETEKLSHREFQYLDELRNLKDELHEIITKYSETLESIQDIKMENEVQVNSLTENLHTVISRYNDLEEMHKEKLKEYQLFQETYSSLKKDHEELLNKFSEHDVLHKQQLEREMSLLNTRLETSNIREKKLEDQLSQVVDDLNKMNASNKELLYANKKALSDLDHSKVENSDMIEKLNKLQEVHENLEMDFVNLKNVHELYVKETNKTAQQLHNQYTQKIEELLKEKEDLKAVVAETKVKINVLLLEKEQIEKNYHNQLQEKNNAINKLHIENESLKQNVMKITEETHLFEKRLQIEEEQYNMLKIKSEENLQQAKERIIKLEDDIRKLKCANSILETGQQQLQKEIETLTNKIVILEESKLSDSEKYKQDIHMKNKEIAGISKTVEDLQWRLHQKDQTINELQKKYDDVCKASEDDLMKIKILFENEKTACSSVKSELETKILELAKEQIQLYELLQKQYELLKINFTEKQQTTEKLKRLIDKYSASDVRNNSVLKCEIKTQETTDVSNIVQNIEADIEVLELLNKKKLENFAALKDMCSKLGKLKKMRSDLLQAHANQLKETEDNLFEVHEKTVKATSEFCQIIFSEENSIFDQGQVLKKLEMLLNGERKSKEILELNLMDLTNEKFKVSQIQAALKSSVEKMISYMSNNQCQIYTLPSGFTIDTSSLEGLSYCIKEVENTIISVINEKREIIEKQKELENENKNNKVQLDTLIEQSSQLNKEKEKLVNDYNSLLNEYQKLKKELTTFDGLSENLQRLKTDYEDQTKIKETLTLQNCELGEHLKELENREIQFNELHNRLIGSCKDVRSRLETLITERNSLEALSTNLVKTFNSVQNKLCSVTDSKSLLEQNQTLEILSIDINKQLEKLSKNLYKISLNAVLNIENVLTQKALSSHATSTKPEVLQIDFEEKIEEINDLKDRAKDILEQLKTFEKTVDSFIATKSLKLQKETVPLQKNILMKDEEYKKKNLALKQKLTLAENAKANLEKKIKQLREENKKLIEKSHPENEIMYKQLLEEHKKTKSEYERILQDCNKQYEALYKEYENYKLHKDVKSEPINIKTENDVEMESIQDAYSKLLSEKYRLEMENETLHSILKEKNSHVTDVELLKENYTKILEEKTRLKTELDTVKYKRTRDREDYMQIINREREKEAQKIQEIRNKYDAKLDLIKQRMITLYNDELEKEIQKKLEEKTENEQLSNMVKNLRIELERANKKIIELENQQRIEKERESHFRHIESDVCTNSRESLQVDGFRESLTRLKNNISDYKRDLQFQNENATRYKAPLDDVFDVPDSKAIVRKRITEEKLYSTLPKNIGMDVIQELTISRKTSLTSLQHHPIGQSLEMEDEESDLFNNKYLTDLKEGRCTLPSNKESNVERLSQLQWRNSLYPPHLKSSYPAETQFNSPSQFKEEDIKTGVVDFDDSMSTKLLPGEKVRKKDIGTTSYKKPGPPTPSKNGGRVSLQGNEIHSKDVLRDHNDKTPKRTTPSRLRALFMGRSSISTRENSEIFYTSFKYFFLLPSVLIRLLDWMLMIMSPYFWNNLNHE